MSIEQSLGFTKNPFSKKSSEQELQFLNEIFFKPNYYETLKDVLSNGDSRFIIGQRGHGKTSIINKLCEDLDKNGVFTVNIDRFDSIPIKKNETALLILILTSCITKLSIYLSKNPEKLKCLDLIDKENLALFIRVFFDPLSKAEYDKIYDSVKRVKRKNLVIKLLNRFGIGLANKTISTTLEVTSSTIRGSLGLPDNNGDFLEKEYIKKIEEIRFEKLPIDQIGSSKEKLKQVLDNLIEIIKKAGYSGTTILIDKIDEYQNLNQDISRITSFTREILSDTELLLNDKFSIGFSLWSELKFELEGIVRFDKFGTIDVRWQSKDLTPLIDKRLQYFSINKKKPVSLDSLLPFKNDRFELIKVANKSPRDLISVLAEIYQVQANNNSKAESFEPECISKGLIKFCENYDYDSITPSKSGKNKEIKAMINRLLKVKLNRFCDRDLTKTFNQSTAQSEGQIKLMIQYKLIREDDILGNLGEKYFEVVDPKVEYLIKRGIYSIE
jgi:hypothetical protein